MSVRAIGTIGLVAIALSTSLSAVLAQEPVYVQRLQLPVLRDDIGFGHGVSVDAHTGEVFVSDPRTNRILIFDRDGYFSSQILGGEDFGSPQDVAIDRDGFLLVLGNRGDRRLPIELDFDGTFRREIPLSGMGPGLAQPRLTSIALSPDGTRMYLVDDANERLLIADRNGRVLKAVDPGEGDLDRQRRDVFLGHVDVYGETVLFAVPSDGAIVRLDLEGSVIDRIGVSGTARCQLGRPTAAALNDAGELLVIDQQRMLLSRWSVESGRCLGEYIGIGSSPGYLYYPFDLALDRAGRLYIGQSWDGRVQVFEGLGSALAVP